VDDEGKGILFHKRLPRVFVTKLLNYYTTDFLPQRHKERKGMQLNRRDAEGTQRSQSVF
jgi:hypothetical protein